MDNKKPQQIAFWIEARLAKQNLFKFYSRSPLSALLKLLDSIQILPSFIANLFFYFLPVLICLPVPLSIFLFVSLLWYNEFIKRTSKTQFDIFPTTNWAHTIWRYNAMHDRKLGIKIAYSIPWILISINENMRSSNFKYLHKSLDPKLFFFFGKS